MDFKKINKIIELFKDSGLGEISIEQGDLKITLKSKNEDVHTNTYIPQTREIVVSNDLEIKKNNEEDEGEWIRAPFVGTYYSAPSENSAPFVTVGQKVKKGDVLCILEAMKVMNEIKANKTGTVKKININNGEMVEFDKKLILIGD